MKLENAKISEIKKAAKCLRESIDESTSEEQMNLVVGAVVMKPDMDRTQAATLLNKFIQSLASFEDEQMAGMALEFTLTDPDERAIVQAAQKKMEAAQLLVKDTADVKTATPKEAQAVAAAQEALKS